MAIFPGDRTCAGHVSGAVEIRRQHSCVPIRAGKTVDKTVYVTGVPAWNRPQNPPILLLQHSFLHCTISSAYLILPDPAVSPRGGGFYGHLLCHQGSTATSSTTGTLLYSTPREDLGLRVYGML